MKDQLAAVLSGLYVSGAGGNPAAAYSLHALKKRVLKTFAIVYIYRGSGLFESGPTGIIPVNEGTVFFLFPGVWHQYGVETGSRWSEYWMLFEGFIPEHYCASGLLNPEQPLLSLGYHDEVIRLFRKAREAFVQDAIRNARAMSGYLFTIFGHLFSRARIQDVYAERERQQISEIVMQMEQSLSEPTFPLERYERKFSVSYSTLRKRFKRMTGYPPAQYFDRLKMSRAKIRLLRTRDLIKTIGADLGYTDPYHFSRRFRNLVGIPPEQFRNEFGGS